MKGAGGGRGKGEGGMVRDRRRLGVWVMRSCVLLTSLLFAFLAIWRADGLADETKPRLPPLTLGEEKTRGDLPFKNVQVLNSLNEAEFLRVMGFVTETLGIKCKFCHNPENYAVDENPHKVRERDMLRMVRFINPTFFRDERVTCFTCHAGKTEPAYLPQGFTSLASLISSGKPRKLPDSYANVRKLAHLSVAEFMQVMAFFVSATGAEGCTACHNPANFSSDEIRRKVRAREMIGLVQEVTVGFFKDGRLTCYTCHRGNRLPVALPDNWLPGWNHGRGP
jgi:Photosynthetic reaction centre cytochrome C subunit